MSFKSASGSLISSAEVKLFYLVRVNGFLNSGQFYLIAFSLSKVITSKFST
jgi:hypothetical protein